MSRSIRLTAVLLMLALAACSTTASRIQGQQTTFDSYPPEVQQKIRESQVAIGFTPEQVRLALGEPSRNFTQETAAGVSEVWAYQDSKPLLSFGLGAFTGGSTSIGGGVGIGTGGSQGEKLRVTFVGGRVSSVEQVTNP